jgi:chemotaxis protein MotA
MDLATIIGIVLVLIAILGSIFLGGTIGAFIDIPSVMCVGLGVVGTTFMKWPMEVVQKMVQVMMKSIFFTPADPKATITEIGTLAETARRESIFALEKVEIADPFLKKAMTLAADNRPPDVIASILQLEIDAMEDRHKQGVGVLDGIAADGPAMGMLGTLIGLVLMLGNMQDQAALGPSMAVALITTFYGSVIANCFALPVKNKIDVRSKMEVVKMNIIVAGTLGIVAGENPRLIKEKLNAFLPPSMREIEDTGKGAE